MKKQKCFYEAVEEYKNDVEYLTEAVILEFTEKIVARMKEQKVSRPGVAKRLGASKASITKVLRGYANLTIRSMVSLANALGCHFFSEVHYKGLRAKTVTRVSRSPISTIAPLVKPLAGGAVSIFRSPRFDFPGSVAARRCICNIFPHFA